MLSCAKLYNAKIIIPLRLELCWRVFLWMIYKTAVTAWRTAMRCPPWKATLKAGCATSSSCIYNIDFFWFVLPFNRCSKKLQRVGKKEGLRLTTVDPVIFLFFTSGSVNPKPFFFYQQQSCCWNYFASLEKEQTYSESVPCCTHSEWIFWSWWIWFYFSLHHMQQTGGGYGWCRPWLLLWPLCVIDNITFTWALSYLSKKEKNFLFFFFIRSRSETSQAWFAYTRVQYSQCSKAESETKAFSASPAAGLTGPGLGCQKNPDC